MAPNFALSLSQDGIVLLHRAENGWCVLGRADPTASTLSEDLSSLRVSAETLASGQVRCKLVIPEAQIKYLTVPVSEDSEQVRRSEAQQALQGATPYAVPELVFDTQAIGANLHIAAVARETLEEAERFATEHGFQPICFVANPEAGFTEEPFFGVTATGKAWLGPDQTPTQDKTPIGALAALPALEPDAGDAVFWEEDTPDPAARFVSRRKVPTFQTPDDRTEASREAAAPNSAPRAPIPKTAPQRPQTQAGQVPSKPPSAFDVPPNQPRAGLMIAAAVVAFVVVAGLAALASGAFTAGSTGFLARLTAPQPEAPFTAQTRDEITAQSAETPPAETADVSLAALESDLTDEDAAVLDALRAPSLARPELQEQIAVDEPEEPLGNIWTAAPDVPDPPTLVDIEDLYVTGIDPINPNFDAVALPALDPEGHSLRFLAPASPAPAGTDFVLDARGLVVPDSEGTMNADGILVFAGPPPVRQPANLLKAEEPGEDLSLRLRLAAFRPQIRPDDLIETSERAAFSGLTRNELSEIRPRLRPQSEQETARATASLVPLDETTGRSLLEQPDAADFDSATARAVLASLRPDTRPRNFDAIVAKATAVAPKRVAATTTAAAPRVTRRQIPSSASVSREATLENAISLRKVNLIGVYGKPSSRRALVRLGNGRYKKVQVGDRIDGGRISAIGESELRYQKSGRAIVLKMPSG